MRRTATVVLVVLIGLTIWVLRAQFMSVPTAVPEGSALQVRFSADARTADDPVRDLATAHLQLCVAEAIPGARVVELDRLPLEPEVVGQGDAPGRQIASAITLQARLEPGADAPDRDQLHGCLEDLRVRHLRLEVHRMVLLHDDEVIEVREA